jgi:hypothetical protein
MKLARRGARQLPSNRLSLFRQAHHPRGRADDFVN